MKSALFVDFDNVFSSLRRLDAAAAERFAFQPDTWMAWLSSALQVPPHAPEGPGRRVLVRRCYLNPQAYQRFRPAFNRAGFEIVDCPPMTREGKTSTDIHMVLDIVDLLQHQVHYDEFIVFSADADFTPVLRKLRRWDRRTTVLAVGFPSAAYQACADLLIDENEFVRVGLGFAEAKPEPAELAPPPPVRAASEVTRDVAAWVRRLVGDSPGELALSALASKAAQEIDGLDPATWGGFGSFRKLVDALALAPLTVDWTRGTVRDPARQAHGGPALPTQAPAPGAANADAVLEDVARLVQAEVQRAGGSVSCARLAQSIVAQHPWLAADWAGRGAFRKFLDVLDIGQLKVAWNGTGGVVEDPRARRSPKGAATADWGASQHLLAVVRPVHIATGMPLMAPAEVRGVLDALSAEAKRAPFALSDTGKRVRDLCKDAGLAVSRADVSFVLKGVLFAGHVFGQGEDDRHTLARRFIDNLRMLCEREQLALDAPQEAALLEWAAGAS